MPWPIRRLKKSGIGEEVGQQQQQQQSCSAKLLWITSCDVPSQRLPFFRRDKAVRIQRPPRTQPIQPLSPKFEACTRWILRGPAHNKTLLAISRQERKGWQWAGKAATVSNWDISWAATLEVGYSILHDVLLNVTQTCKDNNKKKQGQPLILNIIGIEIYIPFFISIYTILLWRLNVAVFFVTSEIRLQNEL